MEKKVNLILDGGTQLILKVNEEDNKPIKVEY